MAKLKPKIRSIKQKVPLQSDVDDRGKIPLENLKSKKTKEVDDLER